MAEIKIPGVGPVDKKKALLIGGGTIAAIAIVLWRRQQQAKAAAAAAPVTDTTDNSELDQIGDPGAIDPATGVPYADEIGTGGQGAFDVGGGDTGLSSSGFDAAGYPIGSAADLAWQAQQDGTSVGAAGGTSITTNSQWLAAAEQALGNTSDIVTALTKVLGGVAVTAAQQQVFMEAVGIVGQPPGGYPTIHLTGTSGAPPASGTSTVSVPNVVGATANGAIATLTAAGLGYKLSSERNPKYTYHINSQTPAKGTKVAKGTVIRLGIVTP